MRSSLPFSARTATALFAAFGETVGYLEDRPDAAHHAIASLRAELRTSVEAVLRAPGRLAQLDHHLGELVALAQHQLAPIHPAAVDDLAELREHIDCERCARASDDPDRAPCTSLRDARELLADARCADSLAVLIHEALALELAYSAGPAADRILELHVRAVPPRADRRLDYGVHAEIVGRALEIQIVHDPAEGYLSFDDKSLYALPFVAVDAAIARAVPRRDAADDSVDMFRDGWLPRVTRVLLVRWCESSRSRVRRALREQCATIGDELVFDRTQHRELTRRGTDAALAMQDFLMWVLETTDRTAWLALSAHLARRPSLDAREIIGLFRSFLPEDYPKLADEDLRNCLIAQDYEGAIDLMIGFAQSFA